MKKTLTKFYFFFQLIYLATRQMIRNYSLATGLDYIELNWTSPKFLPERYQLKYMCTVKGTSKNKAGNTIYNVNKTKNLSSVTTFVIISDLHPSSICTVILLAVYNPASTDTGIQFKGVTLGEHTSTCKVKLWFSDFIAILDYFLCLPIYMYIWSHTANINETIKFMKRDQAFLKWMKSRDWREALIYSFQFWFLYAVMWDTFWSKSSMHFVKFNKSKFFTFLSHEWRLWIWLLLWIYAFSRNFCPRACCSLVCRPLYCDFWLEPCFGDLVWYSAPTKQPGHLKLFLFT